MKSCRRCVLIEPATKLYAVGYRAREREAEQVMQLYAYDAESARKFVRDNVRTLVEITSVTETIPDDADA